MTEEEINTLLLAHANGRPLRDILAEVYEEGKSEGYMDGWSDMQDQA